MKKIFLALLTLVVLMSACSKEQVGSKYQIIEVSELPSNVVEYVDENYPDALIVSALEAKNVEATYILSLNTNEEIAFTSSGECLGNAEDINLGRHQRRAHHGGPRHSNPGHHGGIPIDSIPTLISNYINTNYPTYTIIGARSDTTCQFGNSIKVIVKQAGVPPMMLAFDMNSTFLFSANRIAYNTIPQVVKDSIIANFAPPIKIRRVSEKLILANSDVEYNIHLLQNRKRTIVTTKDNGVIICTR